jgi:hypothetical protein
MLEESQSRAHFFHAADLVDRQTYGPVPRLSRAIEPLALYAFDAKTYPDATFLVKDETVYDKSG